MKINIIYSVFWNEYVVSQIKGKYQEAAMSRLNVSGLKTVRIPWPSENERIIKQNNINKGVELK